MRLSVPLSLLALMLTGAIFGFFYAWACSTMWGLDTLPPEVAIAAMQGMNGSVRNAVFAPAFFGTGPMLLLAAAVCWREGAAGAAQLMALAGVVYLVAGMGLTIAVNVPMNQALALMDPAAPDAAAVWAAYSRPWQWWNVVRTVASGVSLGLAGSGLLVLGRQDSTVPASKPTAI